MSVNIHILIATPHIDQIFEIICSSLFVLQYLNVTRGRTVDIAIMCDIRTERGLEELLRRAFILEGLYKFLSLCENFNKVM